MALTCWKLLVVLMIMLLQQNGGMNHELDEKVDLDLKINLLSIQTSVKISQYLG